MPIIPRASEQVRLTPSAPVAIGSTNDARFTGNVIESAGKAIQDFAQKQTDADRRLRSAEYQSEVENIYKQTAEIVDKEAAPDGSDYGKKMYENSQPRIDEALSKYAGNDPKLRAELGSYTKRVKQSVDTSVVIESAQRLEKHNYGRLEELSNQSAMRIAANPSEELVSAEVKSFGAVASQLSGSLNPENMAKARKAQLGVAAQSYIEGLESQQKYGKALSFLTTNQEDPNAFTEFDPEQAQSLGYIDPREAAALRDKGEKFKVPLLSKGDKVKLTPEMALLRSSMSPVQAQNFADRMKAKIQERTQVRLSDLNAELNGFEAMAMSGSADVVIDDKTVKKLKQEVNSAAGSLSPQAIRRQHDRINTAYAIHQQLKIAAVTPRSQWGGLLESAENKINLAGAEAASRDPRMATPDFAVQANRMQSLNQLRTSMEQIKTQQDKDPAGFMIASDKEVNTLYQGTKDGQGFERYATTLSNKQRHLGLPVNVIPKGEAVARANLLLASPDAESTNVALVEMQQRYGKFFPKVMDEIAKSNKDVADYKVISLAPPESRENLIDAIKNKDAIEKAINGDELLKTQSKTIGIHASSMMSNFRGALRGFSEDSGSVETVNSIQNLVTLQAKRDLIKNPNADMQQVVSKAYNDVVGANFNIIDGGKSSVLVPRRVGNYNIGDNEAKIFKTFMSVYSKPENLKELGVYVPAGNIANQEALVAQGNDPGSQELNRIAANRMTSEEAYLTRLAQNSKWVTNPEQTGLMLVQPKANGGVEAVVNKYGKPVERSYEDIYIRTPDKVREANKGWVTKLFGG